MFSYIASKEAAVIGDDDLYLGLEKKYPKKDEYRLCALVNWEATDGSLIYFEKETDWQKENVYRSYR